MKTKPSFPEFEEAARPGSLIPVYHEFLADTETPVSAYLKIRDDAFSYLLESAEGNKKWGRYSLIGFKPYMRIMTHDHRMEIIEKEQKKIIEGVRDPLAVLRAVCRDFKPTLSEDLNPFHGGLVGYVNYDLVRKWEPVSGISPAQSDMPESLFVIPGRMIIFDHLTHHIKVVAFVHVRKGDNLRKRYDLACQEVDETVRHLMRPLPSLSNGNGFSFSSIEANLKKEDFEEAVRRAKDYIVAGDVIQVVLSQRFSGDVTGDEFSLYRNLRSVNPSPYMFYLNFGEVKFIGSSPEILVRLKNGQIKLRPIAGTRPRGNTPEKDRALEEDLMADPKERAEHVMLVDLGRNDVGRVASAGTVRVPRMMEVERYSHVMHIVSRVEGKLRPELDAFDLFSAVFPAGTVTGAPKIRAMEIINELEPSQRGPYAGAVGYFGFNGNMDFCITIRTITVQKNRLSVQVGAGIVYDSSPEGEYQETLNKAAGLFQAIERANVP